MKAYSIAAVLVGAALVRAQSASPAATLSINPSNQAIICNNTNGGSPFSGSVCQGSQAIVSCSAGVGTAIALSNTTAFPTPTGATITASPSCYQKDGNNAFPAYDNTVYESGSSYTITGTSTSSTSSSSSSSSTSQMGTTTSTMVSTQTFTITSCHPTVTSCPANMATYTSLSESVVTVTSIITTDTTYCPESEATTPVEVPIVVQPTPTPVPEQPTPSPPPPPPETPMPVPPLTPVVPVQPETPQTTPTGCTEGCHVETILSSVVYVIPTPHYAAGNKTTPLPTGGSPSPNNFVASGASSNKAGSLAAALGFLFAALF